MGETREQRVLKQLIPQVQKFTPVASDMFLPNHSGIKSHPEFKDAIGNFLTATDLIPYAKLDGSNQPFTGNISILTSSSANLFTYRDRTANGIMSSLGLGGKDSAGGLQTYAAIYSYADDTTNGSEDGSLYFNTLKAGTSTEKMRITNLGNVGINTATPTQKLQVYSSLADDVATFFGIDVTNQDNGAGAQAGIKFGVGDSSGAVFKSATLTLNRVSPYNVELNLTNSGSFIVTDGYVGIGTTTLTAPLNVKGAAFPVFITERTTTSTNAIGSGFQLLTTSSGDMADGFGGGFVMSIQDTAGTSNNIGRLAAVRNGSDTTGDLVFNVNSTLDEALRLKTDKTMLFPNAANMEFGTTTGTKIGTGTTQKLAFYNSTPIVQPSSVANATDESDVITQLNALLSRMRSLGLIAT